MASEKTVDEGRQSGGAGYRTYVMVLLFLVYTFNFLDRQIISILGEPIKNEFDLTDEQLGALGGFAFAFLYSTFGVPIAWLADRWSRTWIMAISLTLWSAFTAVSGLVQNYTQLFLARMGVGIGEAGGVAPAYSIIADYFPPDQRGRALAFYSLGIPVGSAFGVIAGALIASGAIGDGLDWRAAFIIVGVAGVILAPIFRLTVKEPKRGVYDAPRPVSEGTKAPGLPTVLGFLSKKPSFWFLVLGASCSSMMGYGIFFWIPSFLARSYGLGLVDRGWLFGGILFVGGCIGILMGGVLGDRLGKAKKSAYAKVPAFAFLLTFPFYVAAVLAPNIYIASVLFLVPTALGLMWLGPVLSAFQHLVRPSMRATASSIFLLINNLLGIGVGVYVLGKLSTMLEPTFGEESLRYSILLGSLLYIVAAILFFVAARTLERDWEKDPDTVPVPQAELPTEAEPS
ncbi:MFS transporter [Maricaulis sp. W15]|uniref:Sugar phosphate permease n=2 Tax=Maricaulaceae TaxID=2800061 RepID=A0A495D5P2_9PROT|nr:MFS transporter [Maricaulis sp. W15]RKQ96142.1 sugar phosphate permease [Maricaulis maris]